MFLSVNFHFDWKLHQENDDQKQLQFTIIIILNGLITTTSDCNSKSFFHCNKTVDPIVWGLMKSLIVQA